MRRFGFICARTSRSRLSLQSSIRGSYSFRPTPFTFFSRSIFDKRAPPNESDSAKRKRLLYRCKQRGILELDMLVGTWAEKNIPKLNNEQLEHLEVVAELESPDLLKMLTQPNAVPKELQNNLIIKALLDFVPSASKHFLSKSGNQ